MASSSKGLSQDCQATLIVDGTRYEGSTGKGKGHAEMTALDGIIDAIAEAKEVSPSKAIEFVVAYIRGAESQSVDCPSRPVCLQCGTVLRALKFEADGTHTTWGAAKAGSTEWGCSMNVRALLKAMGIPYEKITAL